MAWWYDRRCGFHVKTWGSGTPKSFRIGKINIGIHHIFPFTCKMDAPSRNINAVPDQQPFTVLVTGANRQVAFLPNNSNDD
jgi:hypothetical protein